jgi:hypothetical protein
MKKKYNENQSPRTTNATMLLRLQDKCKQEKGKALVVAFLIWT